MPTAAKRPLKVFLCHAHSDATAVRALYNQLVKDGVDAWLDKEKLLPGADWEYEIRKAVRDSDVVVVCHSKQFNQKGFRQKEVRIALEEADLLPKGEIFIIPARLEECDVLEDLQRWQWVDLFEKDGYERLMRALRTRANQIGATLQVRKNWLPNITSPQSSIAKPASGKTSDNPKEKIVEKEKQTKDNLPPDNFPDRWEAEWQPTFESDESTKKQEPEKAGRENNEKAKQENAEEKIKRDLEKIVRNSQRKLWWGKFLINVRYRLSLIRIYSPAIISFLIALAALAFLVFYLNKNMPILTQALYSASGPVSTSTTFLAQVQVSTSTALLPSETSQPIFLPSQTSISSNVSTPTPYVGPLPTEITDDRDVKMALVPAGDFIMGSEHGNPNEQPVHNVHLDAFYMDIYEATNVLYKTCVGAGVCTPPNETSSYNILGYYNDLEYNDFPVVYVNWNQANNYCKWRGGGLPTEAQWEKAARGTDGRTYPWGEESACLRANSFGCGLFETKVGSYEEGKSPYAIYDMAGNVQEWVADWYLADYYVNSPASNPLGPNVGQYRVVRGGSFFGDVRSTYRNFFVPSYNQSDVGFRCARLTP